MDDILLEVENLAKQGFKEFCVISQDTSKYGLDNYKSLKLKELLNKMSKIDGVKWIRVLYMYPFETTDELIKEIIENEKICTYFDLPIQHASDKILKSMFHVLQEHSKNNGFVVHMRADEFMLLRFYDTIDQLNQWMELMIQEINQKIETHTKIYVAISSGIYLIEEMNHAVEKMCDCANAARTICKKQQKKYLYFHESMRKISIAEKELEQTIEKAIAKEEGE